jgi:hypothetical protein
MDFFVRIFFLRCQIFVRTELSSSCRFIVLFETSALGTSKDVYALHTLSNRRLVRGRTSGCSPTHPQRNLNEHVLEIHTYTPPRICSRLLYRLFVFHYFFLPSITYFFQHFFTLTSSNNNSLFYIAIFTVDVKLSEI